MGGGVVQWCAQHRADGSCIRWLGSHLRIELFSIVVVEIKSEPSDTRFDGLEVRSMVLCISLHSTNPKFVQRMLSMLSYFVLNLQVVSCSQSPFWS
ncbi:hypothetical protein RHMOL_Rhmol04G0144600 [Rhododendron molle]|uniref:Uncharacterized protein n=1 Tax=Rhododendron molle TaxID=49168 RepID=A0ACC0P2Q9_RHOML|nr:hypothetical protein RHMOL_Rhmol04G0144600 [Rhododendron molle]